MFRIKEKFKALFRSQAGVAYVEFAIALPFLVALFMGAVEGTRYILIVQKTEKVGTTISDLVAQYQNIGTTQLNVLILASTQVMQPYVFGAQGYVIISSVTQTGNNPPVVNWQYKGGGTWVQPSRIGSPTLVASMPNGFTMTDKENVIVTETFYNFTPMVTNTLFPGGIIYKTALFKPRLGSLNTLGP